MTTTTELQPLVSGSHCAGVDCAHAEHLVTGPVAVVFPQRRVGPRHRARPAHVVMPETTGRRSELRDSEPVETEDAHDRDTLFG